ncbi:MAG: histidine--tRNA ligase [Alphaproteobacteria bacterium]|nr:histidine--tRNA ligase [Alphaproteobacteria bacterium]
MAIKSILNLNPPSGFRDFNADTIHKRNFIINIIKNQFELCGFEPLETPALEYTDILTGKYGPEGDKLIFRVLDSGNPFEHLKPESWQDISTPESLLSLKNRLAEKSLRYDLTIPLARYVAHNINKLVLPFKRYQIQPVWRGDSPQKGRYREFMQCDADIIGSASLHHDAELVLLYANVFEILKIPVTIKINHRGFLEYFLNYCKTQSPNVEAHFNLTKFCNVIDKADKIGWQKVSQELVALGFDSSMVARLEAFMNLPQYHFLQNIIISIDTLKQFFGDETDSSHLEPTDNHSYHNIVNQSFYTDFSELHNYFNLSGLSAKKPFEYCKIVWDFGLARGLNYYSGIVMEVVVDNEVCKTKYDTQIKMGSIGGGGRYDNLTAMFGVPNLNGIGISFGLDRIYDVMDALKLFENIPTKHQSKVIFFNLGEVGFNKSFELVHVLRKLGYPCELFPTQQKLDKQFKYAESLEYHFACFIGENEISKNEMIIKNLRTREQQIISLETQANFVEAFKHFINKN